MMSNLTTRLIIYPRALIETAGFEEVRRKAPWPDTPSEKNVERIGPETVRFQALRVGYFAMDSDLKRDRVVLNRIAPLKEDSAKS
ncbi:putative glutamine--tRNA ligase [Diplogelasinospora grovesii]|uniref:Glutamine--tRNA ligase n=1 Tax=Diplogelasinospora grovesii TaxID=303347 RepID=A0AAN6N4N7_9PEZI|nr:putative glutamine--tRNA ligase [Diplogelasinospora grovesii]